MLIQTKPSRPRPSFQDYERLGQNVDIEANVCLLQSELFTCSLIMCWKRTNSIMLRDMPSLRPSPVSLPACQSIE